MAGNEEVRSTRSTSAAGWFSGTGSFAHEHSTIRISFTWETSHNIAFLPLWGLHRPFGFAHVIAQLGFAAVGVPDV